MTAAEAPSGALPQGDLGVSRRVLVDGEIHRAATWVQVERRRMPVTVNIARQSKQLWKLNRELADWRAWASLNCAHLQPLTPPVVVTVEHLRKNRSGWPDTGAPYLAQKAVIDGLVKAGVLISDDPEVVQRLTFEAPRVAGYHALRVTVAELGQPIEASMPAGHLKGMEKVSWP